MSDIERDHRELPRGIELIKGDYSGKHVVSLRQFDPESISLLFEITDRMRTAELREFVPGLLEGKHILLLFYEPSSRTRVSFDSAAQHLGARLSVENNPQVFSSVSKGETFEDTIRTFAKYTDMIVLRHPEIGSAEKAAKISEVPIINAGDGIGEHPTQALLDLFTIWEHTGRLEGLTGVAAGDIKNGRTVHSLLDGLSMYPGNTVYLLSPHELRLDRDDFEHYEAGGLNLVEIENPTDIPKDSSFWYWTRTQKERFASLEEYEAMANRYIVTPEFLNQHGNEDMVLLHPLPRVGEITEETDSDPRAHYFQQVQNGLHVRMALLTLVFGRRF